MKQSLSLSFLAALLSLALLGFLALCTTSRAAPASGAALDDNLVANGGFENGLAGWYMEHAGSGSASLDLDTSTWASGLASARLTLVAQGDTDSVAIHQDGIQVISDTHYTLSFNDFDGDGLIDVDDITAVASHWGTPGPSPYDIDGSGDVDVLDVMLVASTWGASCR